MKKVKNYLQYLILLNPFFYFTNPSLTLTKLLLLVISSLFYFQKNTFNFSWSDKRKSYPLFFLIILSIQAFFTDYSILNFLGNHYRYFGVLFLMFLYMFYLSFLDMSKIKINKIIGFNLIISNLLALIGIFQKTFQTAYGFQRNLNLFDGLAYAGFELPNFFGQYLMMIIGLTLYRNISEHKKYKFLLIFPLIGVFLSGSKAAFLSIALFIFYFLYKKSLKMFYSSILLFGWGTFTFSHLFIDSILTRYEIFRVSFETILKNPFGVNLYGLYYNSPIYINKFNYYAEKTLDITYDFGHNIILDLTLWLGVFGFFVCTYFTYNLLKIILKNSSKMILILGILPSLLLSIFSHFEWIIIILIISIIFDKKNINIKKYEIKSFSTIFILLYLVILLFTYQGTMYFNKYKDTSHPKYLLQSQSIYPYSRIVHSEVFKFLEDDKIDNFYNESKKIFGTNDLFIKRQFLRSKILQGHDMEKEILDLINQNQNDFKNWLLLMNYYKYKKQDDKYFFHKENLLKVLPTINESMKIQSHGIYNNLEKHI